jgi:hypothetical protein
MWILSEIKLTKCQKIHLPKVSKKRGVPMGSTGRWGQKIKIINKGIALLKREIQG